jgi:hypothetical protein
MCATLRCQGGPRIPPVSTAENGFVRASLHFGKCRLARNFRFFWFSGQPVDFACTISPGRR